MKCVHRNSRKYLIKINNKFNNNFLYLVFHFFIYFSSFNHFQGLRSNVTDACERHDPCQHGGICISTDSGPLCECRNLEYEGTYCERGKFNYIFMTL